MRARHTSIRKHAWLLWGCCLIVPTLAAVGCAKKPNLLPVGSPDYLLRDGVRSLAAAAEYSVVATTAKGDKKVEILWTYRGQVVWDKRPLATADRVQFTLRELNGYKNLCVSPEIKNTGKEVETYDCEFDVDKYTAQPLLGELAYWWDEKKAEDETPLPDAVYRTYYLIEQAKPKKLGALP